MRLPTLRSVTFAFLFDINYFIHLVRSYISSCGVIFGGFLRDDKVRVC